MKKIQVSDVKNVQFWHEKKSTAEHERKVQFEHEKKSTMSRVESCRGGGQPATNFAVCTFCRHDEE